MIKQEYKITFNVECNSTPLINKSESVITFYVEAGGRKSGVRAANIAYRRLLEMGYKDVDNNIVLIDISPDDGTFNWD